MKERMLEVTCPACGHAFQLKVHTYLIAGDPQTDGLLASGAFFRHLCGKCGQTFTFQYPFIYRLDKDRLLVLSRRPDLPEFNARDIWTADRPETFCELVRICQNQEEPREILDLKRRLLRKTGRDLTFQDSDEACWWFADEKGPCAIKKGLHLSEK